MAPLPGRGRAGLHGRFAALSRLSSVKPQFSAAPVLLKAGR